MTPGEALLDVPMADLIQKMGSAIAEAQLRLDQMAVRVASLLGEAKVDFRTVDGGTTSKSLLELGFSPTFYHFTETEIEIRMTISLKVEEDLGVDAGANIGTGGGTPALPNTSSTTPGLGGTPPASGGPSGDTRALPTTPGGSTPTTPGATTPTTPGATPAAPATGGDRRAVAFGAAINVEYHRKYGFEMSGSSMVKTKMVSVPPPSVFLETIKESARAGGLPSPTPVPEPTPAPTPAPTPTPTPTPTPNP
jgi:hypothetical protein